MNKSKYIEECEEKLMEKLREIAELSTNTASFENKVKAADAMIRITDRILKNREVCRPFGVTAGSALLGNEDKKEGNRMEAEYEQHTYENQD